MYHSRNKIIKGFTLIELLVVVALVGLLSTLIVITLGNTKTKSFDTRRLADVSDIQKSLEMYSSDFESYPDGNGIVLGDVNYKCLSYYGFRPACPVDGKRVYLGLVPGGPQDIPQSYIYTLTDGGTKYRLEFQLLTSIGDLDAGFHILTPDGIE